MTGQDRHFLRGCLLLLAATSALFGWTVVERRPWFGILSPGHHQWLTGTTLKFTRNWSREGAWNLRFAMLENPSSVEFPTVESRDPYVTYPPAAIVPIYLLSIWTGEEPTPALVMAYNLGNHFLIAYILSLTIYWLLSRSTFPRWAILTLSFLPAAIELLLPGPMYFHQNVFFTDQAVVLPFVLFLFLEVVRDDCQSITARRIALGLQATVFFAGMLTEWFFVVVAIAVLIKRQLEMTDRSIVARLRSALVYWAPGILAWILYAWQIYLLDGYGKLYAKFLIRIGVADSGPGYTGNLHRIFWGHHVVGNFGYVGLGLLGLCLAVATMALLRQGLLKLANPGGAEESQVLQRRSLTLAALYLLPCLVHIYMLRNHTAIHDFSALKFSAALAAVPFVLLPFYWLTHRPMSSRGQASLVFASLMGAGVYLALEHPRYPRLFPQADSAITSMGQFLDKSSQWSDVVFSPDFEIPHNPPQWISQSMKRVYKVSSFHEVEERLVDVAAPCHVALLFTEPKVGEWEQAIQESGAEVTRAEHGPWRMYRVPRSAFARLAETCRLLR